MAPIPRLRNYRGPALFSYGFPPLFLFGALYAALSVALWIPLWQGEITIPTLFAPRDWHVHEMLLTAIPNWTGRLPLQGSPLIFLVLVWVVGRFVVACSRNLGWLVPTIIDSGFLALVVIACAREIAAGENWRNLKVLGPVTVLALTNVGFHWEAHVSGQPRCPRV
jgi:uncharacterized protein involved in response to NO